jgi:hypothetical protein
MPTADWAAYCIHLQLGVQEHSKEGAPLLNISQAVSVSAAKFQA